MSLRSLGKSITLRRLSRTDRTAIADYTIGDQKAQRIDVLKWSGKKKGQILKGTHFVLQDRKPCVVFTKNMGYRF